VANLRLFLFLPFRVLRTDLTWIYSQEKKWLANDAFVPSHTLRGELYGFRSVVVSSLMSSYLKRRSSKVHTFQDLAHHR